MAGGFGSSFTTINKAELYDPGTGSWSNTGDLNFSRDRHTATLLGNGQVLIAGGFDSFSGALNKAERYDPDTGSWSNTGDLNVARHTHTSTLMSDGQVLIAGGFGVSGAPGPSTAVGQAELYDATTGS